MIAAWFSVRRFCTTTDQMLAREDRTNYFALCQQVQADNAELKNPKGVIPE